MQHPRPRSPEAGHLLDDLRGCERERRSQASVSLVGEIVLERAGVGDAHPGEGQSLLTLEVGNLLGRPLGQWVLRGSIPGGLQCFQQARGVARQYGPVGMAPAGHLELDQGLEPQ